MNLKESRRETFKSIGERLVSGLKESSTSGTDTGIQGAAGENWFIKWLNDQLPNRFRAAKGAVVSAESLPTTQRDCIIFDSSECASFRRSGGLPDLFPIEGIAACIEINTGSSGASYQKIIKDCEKLSTIAELKSTLPLSQITNFSPIVIPGKNSIAQETWAKQQKFLIPPVLYIFVESLSGNLQELMKRLAEYNKSVTLSTSVHGIFVLDQGMILHLAPNEGWNSQRLEKFPLAMMECPPWEVMLKMMSILWNQLWKRHGCPDLGPYYTDKNYFYEVEQPRIVMHDDSDYLTQSEEGFVTIK